MWRIFCDCYFFSDRMFFLNVFCANKGIKGKRNIKYVIEFTFYLLFTFIISKYKYGEALFDRAFSLVVWRHYVLVPFRSILRCRGNHFVICSS